MEKGYLNTPYKLFYLEDDKSTSYPPHYHGFHKIIIVLSGQLLYTIEGKQYEVKEGDTIIVQKNDVHHLSVYGTYEYKRIIIYMKESYIDAIDSGNATALSIFDQGSDVIKGKLDKDVLLQEIIQELIMTIQSDSDDMALWQRVLLPSLLVGIRRYKQNYFKEKILTKTVYDIRIQRAISFINKNLDEVLSVEIIANHVYLSKYHFMRLFKKETACSVHKYITNKRLGTAHDMILNGFSFKRAAIEAGFMDYSNFLKAFKQRYNQSPRSYFGQSGIF